MAESFKRGAPNRCHEESVHAFVARLMRWVSPGFRVLGNPTPTAPLAAAIFVLKN